MTVLSGETLRAMVEDGDLVIEPSPMDEQFQLATFDLRLGPHLRDPAVPGASKAYPDEVPIHPWRFYLGHTLDYVEMPTDVVANLQGRSTVGRRGVTVHITAGVIDPGFKGEITLEIVNFSGETVNLPVGGRVAQLEFHRLDRDTDGYDGKYQGQIGPTTEQ